MKIEDTISVYVSTQTTVHLDEDVELSIDDFVKGLSQEDAVKLRDAINVRLVSSAKTYASAPLMEKFYLAVSRGDPNQLLPIAREVLYEYGGRIA